MDPQSRTSPTPPASCDCKHWRIFSSESKAEVSDLPPIGEHGSDLEDAIIIDCPSKHDVSMPMESKHSRQPEAISEPERSDMFNRADTHFAKVITYSSSSSSGSLAADLYFRNLVVEKHFPDGDLDKISSMKAHSRRHDSRTADKMT